MNENIKKDTIDAIAKEHLLIKTLEARNRDSLDFHNLGVWNIRKALIAAYDAGYNAATTENSNTGSIT